MKNLMLFTVLIGLGFTGGSLFPNIMADAENSKAEENCNCGCGPTEVKLMMVPTGSDMLLTTNLIEAISNDPDNSLTSEELVAIISEVQKESTELSNQTAVLGTSIGSPESEMKTTVNSYEEIISRFLSSSVSTTQEITQNETESEPMAEQSSLQSGVIIKEDEITTESSQTKKTKNNNGLGNGSESADATSTDVKGIDPSNPGNGQKNSQKSVKDTSSHTKVNTTTKSSGKTNSSNSSTKATSNTSTKSTKQSSNKSQESKEKEKNNNGLGNGSEPADGTTSDIKGIDPSNPGNGGSKTNAGK